MIINIPPALQRRLDGYIANDGLVEAGRKLAREGVVVVQGFPDASVPLLDDWAVDPFGSRSWQWANAAFRFIPALIAYHGRTADQAALDFALAALRSWEMAVRGPLKNYEFASHDHATAGQAESLVHLLAYLQSRELFEHAYGTIASTIHRHADLLATDEFFSRHTNHGIEQSRILAVIADFFPDDPRSAPRMALALDRLTSELAFAFTKEGVHVENSPGYHVYVCLSFLKIMDYFPRDEIEALAAQVDALMPKAIRFLTHVMRPDGTLPVIGDTASGKVTNYFKRYAAARAFRHFQYAISNGKWGLVPSETTAFYPQAGYFIARDCWPPAGAANEAFHLIFRCGYRSNYHRHDDDLSLVLYCGEDWLIDSGAYSYSERDPLRKYMRSKWAHNVPVLMQPRARRWDWKAPDMTLQMIRLPAEENWVAARGITHSYPGHIATRDVHVNARGREFKVIDSVVQVEPLGRKRYLSLWHVPSDKEVQIDGQRVVLTSKTSGRQLVIENVGRPAKLISLIDPGVEGLAGPVVSWHSNKKEAAQLLAYEWPGNHLHSVLHFHMIENADRIP